MAVTWRQAALKAIFAGPDQVIPSGSVTECPVPAALALYEEAFQEAARAGLQAGLIALKVIRCGLWPKFAGR